VAAFLKTKESVLKCSYIKSIKQRKSILRELDNFLEFHANYKTEANELFQDFNKGIEFIEIWISFAQLYQVLLKFIAFFIIYFFL
jgi:hypothetical protein